MKEYPLVSVIIPTKNSENVLGDCLKSIKKQSYKNIEIVVADNSSSDNTKEIALEYTDNFFEDSEDSEKIDRRSFLRNFAAENSSGKYLLIIDSDMVLSSDVIKSCVNKSENSEEDLSLVISEESFGTGFWAECKKREREYYIGSDFIEAARFFKRDLFLRIGGFDVNLISGEDWDLSNRLGDVSNISRVDEFIFHNEGELKLLRTLKKKAYYAYYFSRYRNKSKKNKIKSKKQSSLLRRYKMFFSKPVEFFKNPILSSGMFLMKTLEFFVGGFAYCLGVLFDNYDRSNKK